jgi:hypothetical protein
MPAVGSGDVAGAHPTAHEQPRMGSGAFAVYMARRCSKLSIASQRSICISAICCCNCGQVEHIGEEMRLAEEKVEKLQAMGGPQLVAVQEAVQAEVQAQEAVVEHQVCSEASIVILGQAGQLALWRPDTLLRMHVQVCMREQGAAAGRMYCIGR